MIADQIAEVVLIASSVIIVIYVFNWIVSMV